MLRPGAKVNDDELLIELTDAPGESSGVRKKQPASWRKRFADVASVAEDFEKIAKGIEAIANAAKAIVKLVWQIVWPIVVLLAVLA